MKFLDLKEKFKKSNLNLIHSYTMEIKQVYTSLKE